MEKSSSPNGSGSVKNRASGSRAQPPAVNAPAASRARSASRTSRAVRPAAAPRSVAGISGKRARSCPADFTGPKPRTRTPKRCSRSSRSPGSQASGCPRSRSFSA